MFKTAAILLFLLSTAPHVCPQSNRAWLNGTWEGTGYQIDTNSTWTMRLKVRGHRYTIEYPSLNCGGRWRLLSINANRARFLERITFGREECVDRGKVVIEKLSGAQIAYRFSNRVTAEVTASAILNRKK
jgi:hypothetical protein